MEKELYYTNNRLISKLDRYFDVSPSQSLNIYNHFYKIMLEY